MKFQKSKFPQSYMFGLGIRHVLDGLVMILSFGNFTTNIAFNYVCKYHKRKKS